MKKIKLLNFFLILAAAGCADVGKSVHDNIQLRQYLAHEDKILAFGSDFIGTPYAPDPLGEGAGFDSDPMYNFARFDCVTYVETVMALAQSKNFDDFITQKQKVSYLDGKPDYIHRKHFFEIDQADMLADITSDMGIKTKSIAGTIDKQTWLLKKDTTLFSLFRPQKVILSYIGKNDTRLLNVDKLPPVSMVGIVSNNPGLRDKIGSDNLISHVGFLINENGRLYIRHASSTANQVVQQDFMQYIANMQDSKTRIGIKIWKIK